MKSQAHIQIANTFPLRLKISWRSCSLSSVLRFRFVVRAVTSVLASYLWCFLRSCTSCWFILGLRFALPGSGPERRDGSFTVLCIMTGTPMFWDFGSSCIRRCGILNARCCGSECKPKFWFSLVLPNVSFLRPAGVRVVPTETFMSAFSLVVSSTGNFNICIFGLHEEVEVQ